MVLDRRAITIKKAAILAFCIHESTIILMLPDLLAISLECASIPLTCEPGSFQNVIYEAMLFQVSLTVVFSSALRTHGMVRKPLGYTGLAVRVLTAKFPRLYKQVKAEMFNKKMGIYYQLKIQHNLQELHLHIGL